MGGAVYTNFKKGGEYFAGVRVHAHTTHI
jgi:hypothetical protein